MAGVNDKFNSERKDMSVLQLDVNHTEFESEILEVFDLKDYP